MGLYFPLSYSLDIRASKLHGEMNGYRLHGLFRSALSKRRGFSPERRPDRRRRTSGAQRRAPKRVLKRLP